MALTEKMKAFAREYYKNGGNGKAAYLTAYDGTSEKAAEQESFKLLKREDINEYIKTLNIPSENQAISERERKRQVLWNIITAPDATYNDQCRAMDILNKMDSEYINLTKTIDDKKPNITSIDSETLRKLSKAQ